MIFTLHFLINALNFLSFSINFTYKSFTKVQEIECTYQKKEYENYARKMYI